MSTDKTVLNVVGYILTQEGHRSHLCWTDGVTKRHLFDCILKLHTGPLKGLKTEVEFCWTIFLLLQFLIIVHYLLMWNVKWQLCRKILKKPHYVWTKIKTQTSSWAQLEGCTMKQDCKVSEVQYVTLKARIKRCSPSEMAEVNCLRRKLCCFINMCVTQNQEI